jgi:nucleoside-diphosphate-sugar epimerase
MSFPRSTRRFPSLLVRIPIPSSGKFGTVDCLVCPPYFVGPFAPGHVIPPGVVDALSTGIMLHSILIPGDILGSPRFGFVDVRDVAEAQVAGIKAPGQHRVLIGSSGWFDLRDAVDHLTLVRPELKDRLANPISMGRTVPVVDNARVVDLLGVSVTPWRKTVEDGIDSLLRVEMEWREAGVDLGILRKNEMRHGLLAMGGMMSMGQAQV